MSEITLCGFINSDLNEVDSVHFGVVYHAYTDREDISCRESDKLVGGVVHDLRDERSTAERAHGILERDMLRQIAGQGG